MDLKICKNCGAMVGVYNDCHCGGCGISCCNMPMQNVTPNTSDGAVEKHMPEIKVLGNNIEVTVNHVMENEHNIVWIALEADNNQYKQFLKAGEPAKVVFPYIKGSKVYAFCNKHGLWMKEVE